MNKLLLKAIKNPDRAFRRLKRNIDHEIEDFSRQYLHPEKSDQTINKIAVRVAGLRRTGNHAIITWICSQLPKQKVEHLNNLIVSENPYRYKYEHLRDHYPEHQVVIERYRKQSKGQFVPRQCLLYSYEDYSLSQFFSTDFDQKHDLYLGKTQKRCDALIIRDPFNLFASRFKNNFHDVKTKGKTAVDLWIEYAKEYLGETQYLKQNKLCINYNQWFIDPDYRQEILDHLGLEYTNQGLGQVGTWGGRKFL